LRKFISFILHLVSWISSFGIQTILNLFFNFGAISTDLLGNKFFLSLLDPSRWKRLHFKHISIILITRVLIGALAAIWWFITKHLQFVILLNCRNQFIFENSAWILWVGKFAQLQKVLYLIMLVFARGGFRFLRLGLRGAADVDWADSFFKLLFCDIDFAIPTNLTSILLKVV